jgi:hypothetical protein
VWPQRPRPPVQVTTQSAGPGRLAVSVSISGYPANALRALRFGEPRAESNALIDITTNQPGRTGPFTVTLDPNQGGIGFVIRPQTPGQPVTVPFVVVDGCGAWPTFVGGGPSAF